MGSVQVGLDDVLRALKRFKRLAKQDILASAKTADPDFWRKKAESRRHVYDWLAECTKKEGVAKAYERAQEAYAGLPLFRAPMDAIGQPAMGRAERLGHRQALELFFGLFGRPTSRHRRARRAKFGTAMLAASSRRIGG